MSAVLGRKLGAIVLSVTVAGICLALYVYEHVNKGGLTLGSGQNLEAQAFTLAVTVNFKEEEHTAKFKEIFPEMAQYCYDHEPDTLSYDMFESDKDPKQILIFERYRVKDSYLHHRESAVFKNFRPQFAALGADISGMSYVQSNLGYMSRRNTVE
eukprot:843904-Prorocentrum_minimum.AAC.2